jgi:flagellar motility protein MotE (MotC chaperone)
MMYRLLIIFIAIFAMSASVQAKSELYDCTQVFEERKQELILELERIDEQEQALNALKEATEELLKQKEAKLAEKEAKLDFQENDLKQREDEVEKKLKKTAELLKALKEQKMDKVSQTYAKMKAQSAADILSKLDAKEASAILATLKPKATAKILSKMDALKASEMTNFLSEVKE